MCREGGVTVRFQPHLLPEVKMKVSLEKGKRTWLRKKKSQRSEPCFYELTHRRGSRPDRNNRGKRYYWVGQGIRLRRHRQR